MYFSSNIKLLRKRKGRTQDELAHSLNMKRSTLSGYENQVAQPAMDALVQFSNYFQVAIDTLVKVDLQRLSERELNQLERGYDVYIRGQQLRVLATTVDEGNFENIELVNEKAKAGYSSGFADPEYIRILPTFQLPFLSKERKYRSFQISGDSMLPIPDGAYVTCEYVQDWNHIQDGKAYVILTREEGVVFKVAENRLRQDHKLILHSLNTLYDSFELSANEIMEVWKFVHFISSELPKPNEEKQSLTETVKNLKQQVEAIQTKLRI